MTAMADSITSTDDLPPYVLDRLFDSFSDESLSDVDDRNNTEAYEIKTLHIVILSVKLKDTGRELT